MSIEAVFAALPDGPLSEKEFDNALRRIFNVREGDFAKLDTYRTTAFHNRLMVKDEDGLLVKAAELPHWPSEEERLDARRAEERRLRFPPKPKHFDGQKLVDESDVNPFRTQLEQLISELVGARVDALEEQVSDLQQQIEAFTPLEVAA
jgi:hypothetical protein